MVESYINMNHLNIPIKRSNLRRNPDESPEQDEIDVFKLDCKKTKEEQTPSTKKNKYTLIIVVVALSIIIVILVGIILWYVMKDNKKEELKSNDLPNTPINGGLTHNKIQPNMMYPNMVHPMYRQMPQTVFRPQNVKEMNDITNTQSVEKTLKPSKTELKNTISNTKLNNIPEARSQKNSERIVEVTKNESDQKKEETELDEEKTDNVLASKFYQKLQQNVNNDEKDDSDVD